MKKWQIGVLVLVSILVCLVYYYPILRSGNNLGIQDWDQNFAWTEASRVSLLDFHQFPLWNPFKCGGSVQFANPQIAVISIQTLFALIFGTLSGIKFSIFFHGVIGFIGFYFLAKQYKLSTLGSLLAAILFSFSGITGSFLSTGMVVFTSFAYTPYILICLNKSFENKKWGIICGLLFAVSFYAGFHIALLLGVYILIYVCITGIVKRTFSPFKALLVTVGTAAFFILPKLALSIQLLGIFPRLANDVSGYSLYNFFYFLLSQKQNLFNAMNTQGYSFAIDENSLYVGILSISFFLLFFILNKKEVKNNIVLLLTMLIIFWLMLGNVFTPSLYALLKHLPVFSSFRVAQRFRFDFIIPFSLLAGLGLDNAVRHLNQNKLARLLPLVCILVIYFDLTIFSSTNFLSKTLIIKNPETQLSRGDAFVQTVDNGPDFEVQRTIALPQKLLTSKIFTPWSYEYLKIKQNQGVLGCYDSITASVAAVGIEDTKYQGEFYLLNPVEGVKVDNTFWSPNKLIYTISNAAKAMNNTLIINQNYYPGWIVRTGPFNCSRAIKHKGLLAAKVDSGDESITLEFNPLLLYLRCWH
jgi:hypothetical protein